MHAAVALNGRDCDQEPDDLLQRSTGLGDYDSDPAVVGSWTFALEGQRGDGHAASRRMTLRYDAAMPEPREVPLTLRISADMSETIDGIAKDEDWTRSEAVRVLLRKGLSVYRKDAEQTRLRAQLASRYGRPATVAMSDRNPEIIEADAERLGVTVDPRYALVMAYGSHEAAHAWGEANRQSWGNLVHGPYQVGGQVRNLIDLAPQVAALTRKDRRG